MVAVLKGLLAGATLSPMEDKLIGVIVGMLGVKLNSQTLSPLGFLKMISGDVEMPEKAFKLLQLANTYSQETFARPIITEVLDGWLGENGLSPQAVDSLLQKLGSLLGVSLTDDRVQNIGTISQAIIERQDAVRGPKLLGATECPSCGHFHYLME
jgi:hypothetical protein